ncbi:hypothetical protein [Janthinobacterium sp. B9-8]|uniref:hypothetical protein n=1 Tax=Janthinobacterium sp. B9-8 TaxID=1236179 RepID=UPI00061D1DFC|nr:hypothetical protein [Janthinobacterium sp. B9-8]AMC33883.1 hypothetical protein VN23_04345 [Janthinobacterium sp. B9-8]
MSVTPNQIHTQVAGAIKALEKLPAKERETKPSRTFSDNYNNLLSLAKEAMPTVDARRWPPEAPTHVPTMGLATSELRFTEIHAFLEQILAIVNEGIQYF